MSSAPVPFELQVTERCFCILTCVRLPTSCARNTAAVHAEVPPRSNHAYVYLDQ
jgi:hypothetical protein